MIHVPQTSKLTLQTCIDICRASKTTSQQMKVMQGQQEDVHIIKKKSQDGHQSSKPTRAGQTTSMIDCIFCVQNPPKEERRLPGMGSQMFSMRQKELFCCQVQKKCRTARKGNSEGSSVRDDDYVLTVNHKDSIDSVSDTQYSKRIFVKMTLNQAQARFQLDCGATVNVLPVDLYTKIFKD